MTISARRILKSKITGKFKKIHGLWGTPTHKAWGSMLRRARGKHPQYTGITIDPSWYKFENFLADMGERPSSDYSLDKDIKFPGNKHYSKQTCMWATVKQQQNAKSTTTLVDIGKKKIAVQHILSIFQPEISVSGFKKRIKRGWPCLLALTEHSDKRRKGIPL